MDDSASPGHKFGKYLPSDRKRGVRTRLEKVKITPSTCENLKAVSI